MRRPLHRGQGARSVRRVRVVALAGAVLLLAALGACAAPDPAPDPDPAPAPAPDPAPAPAPGAGSSPQVPALHPEIDAWPASVVTITPDPDRADGPSGEAGSPVRVDVRVADTREMRRRGLMHVSEVPAGSGMLFVFPRDHDGAFWMLDTLVPLDIAFTRADGTIAAVLTMPPCEQDPCPQHHPGVTYRFALEVPAGWFAEVGVQVGDRLDWTDPQPAGTAS